MDIKEKPQNMDRNSIIKQYNEIQRLRENEDNKEKALQMSKRQMELWDYAKDNGFHRELL